MEPALLTSLMKFSTGNRNGELETCVMLFDLPQRTRLLVVNLALVKGKLLALENIAVAATRLTWPRRDDGV